MELYTKCSSWPCVGNIPVWLYSMQQVLNSPELSPTVSHRSSWRSLPGGTRPKKDPFGCMYDDHNVNLLYACTGCCQHELPSNCDLHLRSAFLDAVSVLENT